MTSGDTRSDFLFFPKCSGHTCDQRAPAGRAWAWFSPVTFPDVPWVICCGTHLVPNQQLLEQSPGCHTGPVPHCVEGGEGERGPADVPFPRWRAAARTDRGRLHNPQKGGKGSHVQWKHSHGEGGCCAFRSSTPPKHTHPGMWLAAWTQLECTEDLPVLSAKWPLHPCSCGVLAWEVSQLGSLPPAVELLVSFCPPPTPLCVE